MGGHLGKRGGVFGYYYVWSFRTFTDYISCGRKLWGYFRSQTGVSACKAHGVPLDCSVTQSFPRRFVYLQITICLQHPYLSACNLLQYA